MLWCSSRASCTPRTVTYQEAPEPQSGRVQDGQKDRDGDRSGWNLRNRQSLILLKLGAGEGDQIQNGFGRGWVLDRQLAAFG